MKVYVVFSNWYYGGENSSEIFVFDSLDKAKAQVEKLFIQDKKDYDFLGEDLVIDKDIYGCYEMYEDGNFYENGVSVDILEKEIM